MGYPRVKENYQQVRRGAPIRRLSPGWLPLLRYQAHMRQ
jgi:hypothetical protein